MLAPEHALPVATHVSLSQHPSAHWLPAQQCPPAAPQDWHVPPEHTVLAPSQLAPSATHWPELGSQQSPALHVLPAQHEWPVEPQVHEPSTQR